MKLLHLQKMEMLCRMMDSLSEVGRARGACDSMALAYILLHRSSGLRACSRFKSFDLCKNQNFTHHEIYAMRKITEIS